MPPHTWAWRSPTPPRRSSRGAKIDDPFAHFKGKSIRVYGVVALKEDRPQIVADPEKIEIVG